MPELDEVKFKLDAILGKVNHIEELLYGAGDREGMRIDVDRLKQNQKRQQYAIGVLAGAVVTAGVSYFFNLIS